MSETALVRAIQIAVSSLGARVSRNNCGSWQDVHGNWIKYGVFNPGGSDLIGWTKDGRFLAIEVKTPRGQRTEEQVSFHNAVRSAGGVAFVARSVEEAIEKLTRGAGDTRT